jgi:hypothetical protein
MNRPFQANFSLVIAIILQGMVLSSASFASRNGNGEYWQGFGIDYELNKDWKITVREELRFGKDNGNPYLHNTDIGLVYKSLGDWIDLGFNFKKEYEKDSSDKFRHENRPNFNIMLKGNLFDLDVRDRIRLEYRDFELKEDIWRFRNKTTVNLPLKLTKFNLQPYIADEVFINLGQSHINQNRLYVGFSFDLAKNLKAGIYYMLKSNKQTYGWSQTNVVGTQFVFLF